MPVPYTFGTATTSIPLSNLDANFNTPVTIGNTTVGLGNTVTTIGNLTLTNATISTGNVTVTTGVFGAGSNTAPSITTTGDTNTGIFFPAADTIAFTEGGVESMRIDSTGQVGIGTASPTANLNVYSNAAASTIRVTGDGFGATLNAQRYSNDASSPFLLFNKFRGSLASPLAVNSLDVAGNVAFQAYGGTNSRTIANVIGTVETYTSDTNISGYLAFNTNAGSTSTTERMRITSTGSVGIGTTSTVNTLDVRGSGAYFYDNSSADFQITVGSSLTTIGSTTATPLVFKANGTERMRIDSSGNVGIGTTATTTYRATIANTGGNQLRLYATDVASSTTNTIDFWYLDSGGSPYNNTSIRSLSTANAGNGNLVFYTTPTSGSLTERMRILSGGSVCVNTTAAVVDSTSRLIVETTTANGVAAEFTNNTSGTCSVAINNSGAATSTLINWIAAGSYRAAVTWNGTNIIYGTPSDQRLKENIVDSSSALISINNIKIRSFDFKENGNHVKFGVIAQELESIFPEAVLKGIDNEDGSIKESWSVDTSTLVPMLVKAIQEQQALIQNLTTRLNALEGN